MAGGSGDFCVVVTGMGEGVLREIVVWTVVSDDGNSAVAGNFSTILNVAELVTSIVSPDTVTIYSSGLNEDASTLKDQRFNPPAPGSTLTVPADPENSPL